jgi:hypothetical protein
MIARLFYRSRQFWRALRAPGGHITSEALSPYLSPAQQTLFHRMQPAEQAHAFQVLDHLKASGFDNPDLLAAALLHDVGKVLYPLSLFDRVVIVLGRRFFPRAVRRWEEGTPRGLRRPFVVAARHAEWGADLATQAGASSLTVELVRRHQASPADQAGSPIEHLLAALQAADEQN